MKILTVTCHAVQNHGACLQAYALATYLKSQGVDVEIIDYRPEKLYNSYSFTAYDSRFENSKLLKTIYILSKFPSRVFQLPRKWNFSTFVKNHLPITKKRYTSFEKLYENPPEGDLYICGSDQIWNTYLYNGTDQGFYLNFVRNGARKISYSASFGYGQIDPRWQSFVENNLKRLDAISVREESGRDLISKMGLESSVTLDSVFLLDAKHWSSLIKVNHTPTEKYILVYDFEVNEVIKYIAQRLAKQHNAKIYSIGSFKLKYADKNFTLSGPLKFLELIKGATCVIGNSFHGVLFSIIFRRNFYIIKRDDGLNSRMEDFLNRYGLQDRILLDNFTDCDLTKDVDFDSIQGQLNNDIIKSKNYLESQINLARNK